MDGFCKAHIYILNFAHGRWSHDLLFTQEPHTTFYTYLVGTLLKLVLAVNLVLECANGVRRLPICPKPYSNISGPCIVNGCLNYSSVHRSSEKETTANHQVTSSGSRDKRTWIKDLDM